MNSGRARVLLGSTSWGLWPLGFHRGGSADHAESSESVEEFVECLDVLVGSLVRALEFQELLDDAHGFLPFFGVHAVEFVSGLVGSLSRGSESVSVSVVRLVRPVSVVRRASLVGLEFLGVVEEGLVERLVVFVAPEFLCPVDFAVSPPEGGVPSFVFDGEVLSFQPGVEFHESIYVPAVCFLSRPWIFPSFSFMLWGSFSGRTQIP